VEWKVPLADVQFNEEEFAAVQNVLKSGWLTMGEITQEFEKEFCSYTGTRYAFAVNNATASLHLACQSIGLGTDDEVIVPSLTFVATANAIRYTGATPIFADITNELDLTISVAAIEQAITERTRAIMVMHYGGYACDMSAILALADKYHLKVIEDAAHAAGSFLEGRHLGTFGAVGCFSFFSNKNMTTGEGGMLITNDEAIADQVRVMRSHGMTSLTWDRHQGHAWSYDVVGLGYNYRIDEIRSALGRVQLRKLKGYNQKRRELTNFYRELVSEMVPSITVPFLNHPGISACHLMPVLLPEGIDRIRFMEWMKSHGIQTSIHYPPIHTFSAFARPKEFNWNLQKTENIGGREVTLPLYPGLTHEQAKLVVESIRDFLLENN
jgi:dTDP-4-amino-4,6-dideoxygalactose transaminase